MPCHARYLHRSVCLSYGLRACECDGVSGEGEREREGGRQREERERFFGLLHDRDGRSVE